MSENKTNKKKTRQMRTTTKDMSRDEVRQQNKRSKRVKQYK